MSELTSLQLEQDGFALLPSVFNDGQVERIRAELTDLLHGPAGEATTMRSQSGNVYGARNLLELWPHASRAWRQAPLPQILAATLGPDYGLVRVLYFDKPPDRSWALPWHKDLTIAVREHRGPTPSFSKPTRKAGVPHMEASCAVLEAMLTIRIHVDEVTEENGPLQVIPGSHRSGKELLLSEAPPHTVLARRGDVLLMRPLLAHSSRESAVGTQRHRRILHLECSGSPLLPDGYAWHDFIPATSA
jgi:Phytanoyl-CoA dioxygenase (PhyH)